MTDRLDNGDRDAGFNDPLAERFLAALSLTTPRASDPDVAQRIDDVLKSYAARKARKTAWLTVAAAALVAIAIKGICLTAREPRAPAGGEESAQLVSGAFVGSGAPSRNDRGIPMRSRLVASERGAGIAVSGGADLFASPGSALSFSTLGAKRIAVELESGRLSLDIPAGNGWQVAVDTDLGTVEVVGTVFTVARRNNDLCVRVDRGAVRIAQRFGTGQGDRTVTAGETVCVGRPAPAAFAAEAPSALPKTPPAEVHHPSRSTPATATVPAPQEMLEAARRERMGGDYDKAAESYESLLSRYPDSPEARTALVSLASIELDALSRPAKALEHYRHYLKTSGGLLALEASYGICRALRALGRTDEEQRALAELVAAYPQSLQASAAKNRLGEIGR